MATVLQLPLCSYDFLQAQARITNMNYQDVKEFLFLYQYLSGRSTNVDWFVVDSL